MNALRTRAVIVVACSLIVGVAAPAWAGRFDVETKLTASDGAADNGFGDSVAISGNTAIVGAPWADTRRENAGSAYLFDVTTGNELFKLTASDAATGDEFGYSAGINAGTAIVGALGDNNLTGSAYLFDATTGNELFKLTASDAAAWDKFGVSVAISGNRAIVGANTHRDVGAWSGSAYVFDVTTGNELFKLTASDAAAGDLFGNSVAISAGTAIVGAWRKSDAGYASGSAYLFDVTTGNELFKLTAFDAAAEDNFGWSVGIDGNTAIVGAHGDDDGGSDSGSAYVFDVTTGNQLFKLTASDAAAGDAFGYSVGISGNTAIVGTQYDDDAGSDSGSVYLFDVTTGTELQKLTASDAAPGDLFGDSVAISAGTAIVGAAYDDDTSADSGSAYLFGSEPSIQSDLDLDGDVDDRDLNLLLSEYGTTCFQVDVDALLSNFGRHDMPILSVGNSLLVPEPSGFLLAALGFLSLLACAGRRRAT